ncbi:MAG: hypothetical protein JO212_15010 [Acetobacteraceae bacterium]|nr:hypothetical protein [Acetobacteraceae bacterium]
MKRFEVTHWESRMKDLATSTATLRHKVVHEFKELAALALYLYVCLGRWCC